jgi:hypothetical protein
VSFAGSLRLRKTGDCVVKHGRKVSQRSGQLGFVPLDSPLEHFQLVLIGENPLHNPSICDSQ